jgi:hypothetical protein
VGAPLLPTGNSANGPPAAVHAARDNLKLGQRRRNRRGLWLDGAPGTQHIYNWGPSARPPNGDASRVSLCAGGLRITEHGPDHQNYGPAVMEETGPDPPLEASHERPTPTRRSRGPTRLAGWADLNHQGTPRPPLPQIINTLPSRRRGSDQIPTTQVLFPISSCSLVSRFPGTPPARRSAEISAPAKVSTQFLAPCSDPHLVEMLLRSMRFLRFEPI